jgi:hypothetical protein
VALDSLTDCERTMLHLERHWYNTASGKELAVETHLGLKPTRYYQLLNRLIRREAALVYDPVTVNRLRRVSTGDGSGRAAP